MWWKKILIQIAGGTRILFAGLAIIFKILFIAMLVVTIREHALIIYLAFQVVSWITIILLVGSNKDAPYTMAWLILIAFFSVFGYILYLMWARPSTHEGRNSKLKHAIAKTKAFIYKDTKVYDAFVCSHPSRKKFVDYLGKKDFPLYKNTKCTYYPLGELQFEALMEDMEKAEKSIFLAFFIVRSGQLWDRMEEIMIRKAEEGVEVRFLCDDLGSLDVAPDNMMAKTDSENLQVIRFNPIHKHITRFSMNYRNHQKIAIIDGQIGYTGGSNLADEYVNLDDRLGHWKDTAIRLEGDAVYGLTITFLQMWESESNCSVDYELYRPTPVVDEEGFYQPFHDGPVNNPDNPAEAMYNLMIYNAKKYLYITTPYLVVDDAMMEALCTAAQGGIDVRIITPKRWDKFYVNMVTVSNYGELLRSGVRIYEYSPGFIHAKTILSDDDHAITGTINMDYRSFNLHFENGVWICGANVLGDIKQDILETFAVSEEIKYETWAKRPWYIKLIEILLRPFAVLL